MDDPIKTPQPEPVEVATLTPEEYADLLRRGEEVGIDSRGRLRPVRRPGDKGLSLRKRRAWFAPQTVISLGDGSDLSRFAEMLAHMSLGVRAHGCTWVFNRGTLVRSCKALGLVAANDDNPELPVAFLGVPVFIDSAVPDGEVRLHNSFGQWMIIGRLTAEMAS